MTRTIRALGSIVSLAASTALAVVSIVVGTAAVSASPSGDH